MAAIHASDINVKEYLRLKLNEAENLNVVKATEVLMEKRKIEDLTFAKNECERQMKSMETEVVEFKSKSQKELKHLREKVSRLNEQNCAYLNAIEEMRKFFNKVSNN